MRAEVSSIERQLRMIAAERKEAAQGAELQARLSAQLDALPPAQRASAGDALRRAQAELEAYAAAQAERQHTVHALVARIAELREDAATVEAC